MLFRSGISPGRFEKTGAYRFLGNGTCQVCQRSTQRTGIYQQAFTLINGELQPGIDAQIIPCTLSSVSSYNDFRPTVASGEKAQEICNLMNTYSQNCSNIEIDELGKLHVN